MKTGEQIKEYLQSLPAAKRADMETLHEQMLHKYPAIQLWFFDGKDETGKVVANPQIGYGLQTMTYAGGKTRPFYQIGISGNTTGISVYIMGLADKNYLPQTYTKTIGKASVTGYCIKFRNLAQIHGEVLERAIQDGMEQTSGPGI